jgi:hypothetical protein
LVLTLPLPLPFEVPRSFGALLLKRWKRGSLRKLGLIIGARGPTETLLGRNCALDVEVAATIAPTATAVQSVRQPISPKRWFGERMAKPPSGYARSIFGRQNDAIVALLLQCATAAKPTTGLAAIFLAMALTS